MKNRKEKILNYMFKEKILNKIFEEDKNNLCLLDIIQRHQIMKVINCYQNYINRFNNISNDDLNNLYNMINKDLLNHYE